MKIVKIADAEDGEFIYRVTLDQVETCCCEHCGEFKSRNYYFVGIDEDDEHGIAWCKQCADTFKV